jgi:hypothetical protein
MDSVTIWTWFTCCAPEGLYGHVLFQRVRPQIAWNRLAYRLLFGHVRYENHLLLLGHMD